MMVVLRRSKCVFDVVEVVVERMVRVLLWDEDLVSSCVRSIAGRVSPSKECAGGQKDESFGEHVCDFREWLVGSELDYVRKERRVEIQNGYLMLICSAAINDGSVWMV